MSFRSGVKNPGAPLRQEGAGWLGIEVAGAIGGYVFKPDNRPDELIGVAIFRDRESYRDPREDPQGRAQVGPTVDQHAGADGRQSKLYS